MAARPSTTDQTPRRPRDFKLPSFFRLPTRRTPHVVRPTPLPEASSPVAAPLPPKPATTHIPIILTESELQMILTRRLQNLSLPETPHLLLAERFSSTLTVLTSLAFKLHLLQTPQVTAFRAQNDRLFSRLRLLSLLNLPGPRLMLYPFLRHLPALHWLLTPFRAMAFPFLLDALIRFTVTSIRRCMTPRTPDFQSDLSSLRDHLAEKLRQSREHMSDVIAKAGTELGHLKHELEMKIPPALALPPSEMPFTPRERTVTLRTPVRGRSFQTPVKGRAFRRDSADLRRGLLAAADSANLESPSLTLLPQSIAQPEEGG